VKAGVWRATSWEMKVYECMDGEKPASCPFLLIAIIPGLTMIIMSGSRLLLISRSRRSGACIHFVPSLVVLVGVPLGTPASLPSSGISLSSVSRLRLIGYIVRDLTLVSQSHAAASC
jgi:hypothetical protein